MYLCKVMDMDTQTWLAKNIVCYKANFRKMDKRFIGVEELANYLDLSPKTIRSWVLLRRVPYVKLGRLVKFDLRKIEDWLKDKRIEEFS